MIPVVVLFFYLSYPWASPVAAIAFIVAAITDSLDGYFARKYGQTTALGAFLERQLGTSTAATLLLWRPGAQMPSFDAHATNEQTIDRLRAMAHVAGLR